MKNLLDENARAEMLRRMEGLSAGSLRQWGGMRPDQMIHHINRALSYSFGEYEIPFRGNFFTKYILRPFAISPSIPFPKAKSPSISEFEAKGDYDIDAEKQRFREFIARYAQPRSRYPDSPLLGKMSAEDWGKMHYKHLDHHLRQFGL